MRKSKKPPSIRGKGAREDRKRNGYHLFPTVHLFPKLGGFPAFSEREVGGEATILPAATEFA